MESPVEQSAQNGTKDGPGDSLNRRPESIRSIPQINAAAQAYQGPSVTAAITSTKCWNGAMAGKYTKVFSTKASQQNIAASTIL